MSSIMCHVSCNISEQSAKNGMRATPSGAIVPVEGQLPSATARRMRGGAATPQRRTGKGQLHTRFHTRAVAQDEEDKSFHSTVSALQRADGSVHCERGALRMRARHCTTRLNKQT